MGAVDTTYTFTATDTITSTKMNNIIDQTTITSDAIIGTTLEVASGKLKVRAAGITSNEMANNSVVTASIADSNITTVKIANSNITPEKLSGAQTGSAPIFGIRAFGAFNGTATTPIAPISAGNIASIVRTSTGTYTVTLTTAMSDTNYCVVVNEFHHIGVGYGTSASVTIIDSSSFTIQTGSELAGPYNSRYIGFLVIK